MRIMRTIDERWQESGYEHDSRSIELAYSIRDLDTEDQMDLKFGGDGDNGEILLYLLDMHFEREDEL